MFSAEIKKKRYKKVSFFH